ncbi:hypothetical protein B0H11DRAFT_512049 [Mycena galericulata]|nr:hypothetical protein B0H11DRAFT_512049 [Mycena galericulata]
MLRLISTTARKQSQGAFVRLHRDVPITARAGVVYYLKHIDIAPPGLLTPKNYTRVRKPESQQDSNPVDPQIKIVEVDINLSTIGKRLISALQIFGIIALVAALQTAWEMVMYQRVMQGIVDNAPDLDALDDAALANHLDALMKACLMGRRQRDVAPRISHLLSQGSEGRAVIKQACKRIHAILKQDQIGAVRKFMNVVSIVNPILNPASPSPAVKESTVTQDSDSFSELDGQPADDSPVADDSPMQ